MGTGKSPPFQSEAVAHTNAHHPQIDFGVDRGSGRRDVRSEVAPLDVPVQRPALIQRHIYAHLQRWPPDVVVHQDRGYGGIRESDRGAFGVSEQTGWRRPAALPIRLGTRPRVSTRVHRDR